jgi:hypothetical protein
LKARNKHPADYFQILILNESKNLENSLPHFRLWGFSYLNIKDFNDAAHQFGFSDPKLYTKMLRMQQKRGCYQSLYFVDESTFRAFQ